MKFKFIFASIVLLAIAACSKEEGPGGNCTIEGKVYVLDYNQELTTKLGEYYGSEINVYLIYGDDIIYSEDFKTNYDGSYRFDYLKPGKYTVFTYSEDTTQTSEDNKFAIFKTVEFTKNNLTTSLEDFIIVR
ncbi:MAG: hypothetical protein CVU11_15480 [Bacteroidetes bacterium HGW-Bacteroidetes-6]|jgi:hypothetical protein|nr:MAG: hypothetical protein CVU11_15480 [Bacteroidetes bacterium HGW-Bacteroidetes-6]